MFVEVIEHAISIPGCASQAIGDDASVIFSQAEDLPGSSGCLLAYLLDALQKERQPRLPRSFIPYGLTVRSTSGDAV